MGEIADRYCEKIVLTSDDYYDEDPKKIIDDIAAGRPVKPGPQNGRQLSAPEGGPATLLDTALYDRPRIFERVEGSVQGVALRAGGLAPAG